MRLPAGLARVTNQRGTQICVWEGAGSDPKATYHIDFKKYVSKIISKSPSHRLFRLQGKLKASEKERNLQIHKFLLYFPVFQCEKNEMGRACCACYGGG
jgi:hypothetical protein